MKLEQNSWRINYFLLNPAGHFGEAPVTFLIVLPFTHVIEVVLGVLLTLVVGVLGVAATGVLTAGVAVATASFCFNLTFRVGEEKVIP